MFGRQRILWRRNGAVELPELGVGLMFLPGLGEVVEAGEGLIDVIEVEPQTLWVKSQTGYRISDAALKRLHSFPQKKIVHGVGCPIGGTCPIDAEQAVPFAESVALLQAPWASEHLAFRNVSGSTSTFDAGFFLSPIQTIETAAVAIANIKALGAMLPVPLAFETGVNYLKPYPGEMSDGSFFKAVADGADCGIVLDLHNLWCNQLNGRQAILDVLSEVPSDRIWEIHLAGGDDHNGYWLDAHSGLVPPPLMKLAREVIPYLPKLKAIIFEIVPDYLGPKHLDTPTLLAQIESIRELWELRPKRLSQTSVSAKPATPNHASKQNAENKSGVPSTAEWERAVGTLTLGRPQKSPLEEFLKQDPGIEILRQLVFRVRIGTLVDTLPLTYRLLVLSLGEQRFDELVGNFFAASAPLPFALDESERFIAYLTTHAVDVRDVEEVARFELAVILTALDGQLRHARFGCDPTPLLSALENGRLPTPPPRKGEYELAIHPLDSVSDGTSQRPTIKPFRHNLVTGAAL